MPGGVASFVPSRTVRGWRNPVGRGAVKCEFGTTVVGLTRALMSSMSDQHATLRAVCATLSLPSLVEAAFAAVGDEYHHLRGFDATYGKPCPVICAASGVGDMLRYGQFYLYRSMEVHPHETAEHQARARFAFTALVFGAMNLAAPTPEDCGVFGNYAGL